jgi:hypothetical protein
MAGQPMFSSCVFGLDDDYAILDGRSVFRLPLMKQVLFSAPLLQAVPLPGIMIGVHRQVTGIIKLVIYCTRGWFPITQFAIDDSPPLVEASPKGRYITLGRRDHVPIGHQHLKQLIDLYKVPTMKLWNLLLSLLHVKSPLLTKGCYHPIVFVSSVRFFTPVSISQYTI